MNHARKTDRACAFRGAAVVCLLVLTTLVTVPRPAVADDAQDAQQLVEKARLTFEAFVADKDMGPSVKALLKRAKGVLIYPQVLRAAFIFGASGGSGTFLVHDAKAGAWGGPAFYTIGEASFGLQVGGDASEVVLVALSDRGVASLLSTSTKLGGNVGIAAGPIGVGAEAATANLSADVISYSRSKGVYAGVSLDGAVVATRGALNAAYYGKEATPTEILIQRAVTNPHAASLIQAVSREVGKKN
ncbi:MAG: lipid-binding SYLF domain-containing protein [candidate division NC10 bacterium]|nr:lipid-binding SYLF domain-containing protein [candidate division NC10 bacterium]